MDDTWCVVDIDFYKPTGFRDRWLVHTVHRGEAARLVMDNYTAPQDITMCLNNVAVRFASDEEIRLGKQGVIPILPKSNTPPL